MNKYLIGLIIFFVLSSSLKAQVGSPYSQYGVGEVANGGFGQSTGMGGIGIGLRNNFHLNPINPASYSALDSMTVIYELGLSTGFNQIESNFDNVMKTDSKIDFLALGFRANKFYSMGFGLMPTSTMNYTLSTTEENPYNGIINTYYHGNGGLTKIYWDNSFVVTEGLTLGVSLGYVFGSINKVNSVIFEQDYNASNSKSDEKVNLYNLNYKFGAQYITKLDKKKSLVFGVVYEPQVKLNSKKTVIAGTTAGSDIKDVYYEEIIDTIYFVDGEKSKISYPSSFGIGISFINKEKFTAGIDFTSQNWSSLSYEDLGDSLKNSMTIKGGLEYIPEINSIGKYHKRIRYRIGGYYNQSHLEIKSQRIDDYGISFGVGLPLRNTKTSFNISYKMGQRGTLNNNLLKETYGILSLNLSLSDIWFVKRKFK